MKKLLFSIILLGFTGCVVSETLPCGQSLFQTGAFEQLVLYNGPGSHPAKLDIITVKHPEFNKAFRIKVQDKQKEPWDNSLTANNSKPVKKKDIVFVSYLARKTGTDTGQGYLQTTMSEPMPSFLPLAALDQTLTDQWTHGKLAFKANYDYKPNEIQLSFQLGFYSQTVEIADVRFVNLGSDTNIKGLGLSADVVIHNAKRKQMTYEGRDPNAPWRKEAFERIEKVRKGDLTITVKDKNDNPLPNAKVTVKQLKHKFWFGNEIRALTIIGDAGYLNSRNITAADSQKYMETVKELFNVTAFGQAMVWFYWDKHGRQTTKQVYDEFLKPNDIALRGIPLVWSGRQEWKNPKGLVDLPSEKLREKIKQHVIEMLEVHKGNAVMWDVLNEPISEPDFINKLGKDEAVKWFKLVRKLEPKAKLYCNEYGLLQDKEKLEKFIELIKYLKENGAPIDGVSPQSHLFPGQSDPISIHSLKESFDMLGSLGLDVYPDQFEAVIPDENVHADYTRDFYILAFSHPAVVGVTHWGFWEGEMWMTDAAWYRKDWSPKPIANAYKDLVFNKLFTPKYPIKILFLG